MTNIITGLVHVTGEPDTGKTTFSLTCRVPVERIAFFDDDIKGQAVVKEIEDSGRKLGAYHNLVKLSAGMREIEFHNLGLKLVEALQPGKFDALIWDTWSRYEATFFAMVNKNPAKFKEIYSSKGNFKGAQEWKASFDYEAQFIDNLLSVVPLVIFTTHLKEHHIGEAKTGREVPDSKKTITQKSRLRLWLRHNANSPAPIGLVLKRISKTLISPTGELETVSVLPRKLTPCTWKKITEYWNTPVGDRELTPDEKPNEFEMGILDGVLTDDQKDALRIQRIELEREEKAQMDATRERRERAKALRSDGHTMPEIAVELGVDVKQIIAWVA